MEAIQEDHPNLNASGKGGQVASLPRVLSAAVRTPSSLQGPYATVAASICSRLVAVAVVVKAVVVLVAVAAVIPLATVAAVAVVAVVAVMAVTAVTVTVAAVVG